ncbi:PREDICTED: dnaJ homolog subfamily C member 28 [Nanorana parkeri]|uniref:dnaJ homolog subfamily C member 28 n=1 Tax=Nanorana parkeri TaxID=125878 RepID=UPI0008541322|nr:PREDICTED: dnaJ homolog subfamily C member 28 [Nanorana parkeri]
MKLARVFLPQNIKYPLSVCSWSPTFRMHSTYQPKRSIRDCYGLLGVSEGCSEDEVRHSYRKLAKKYHPDSGAITADGNMFMQIDEAYRDLLTHLAQESKKAQSLEDDEEKTSEYKVPQHRQYLSYEGVGYGTPSQRQRQYAQFRVDRATDQVLDFRKKKFEREYAENSMVAKDIRQSKKVKITQAIERLVEDLIQESMAKGDFDNLGGKGKPINKFSTYPHIDPMTHNLNRILIDNGYQPEWIVLQKEIRDTIDQLRSELVASRKKIGELMTYSKEKEWMETCENLRENITKLNKKVNDFNLVVPLMSRQMVHFNVEKEISRAQQAYCVLKEEMESAIKMEAEKNTGYKQTKPMESIFNWINQFKKV